MLTSSTDQPTNSDLIAVARILGIWGRVGHLKIESLTDIPGRFISGAHFIIRGRVYISEGSRQQGKILLLKLQGINDRNAAAELHGELLETYSSDSPNLPEGTFFHYQIIGMDVQTTDGLILGKIIDIVSTGSNDVYVVHSTNGEVLIPATSDVVTNVDMQSGTITVSLIKGLL